MQGCGKQQISASHGAPLAVSLTEWRYLAIMVVSGTRLAAQEMHNCSRHITNLPGLLWQQRHLTEPTLHLAPAPSL